MNENGDMVFTVNGGVELGVRPHLYVPDLVDPEVVALSDVTRMWTRALNGRLDGHLQIA